MPEPETDLDTTLNQFSQTGFSQSDAIVRVLLRYSAIFIVSDLIPGAHGLRTHYWLGPSWRIPAGW